jgi:regulator of replication initiation timing
MGMAENAYDMVNNLEAIIADQENKVSDLLSIIADQEAQLCRGGKEKADILLELAKSNDALLLANRGLKAEITKKETRIDELDATILEILNTHPDQEIADLKEKVFSLDCQMNRLVDENEALRSDNKSLEANLGSARVEQVRMDIALKTLVDDMGTVKEHHEFAEDLFKEIMDKLEGMVGGDDGDGDEVE